jgi:hypothetical protein
MIRIVKGLLGQDPLIWLLASDAPFPGSELQPPHLDVNLWYLLVNITLVDTTIENGALEYWPGTHRELADDGSFYFSEEMIHASHSRRREKAFKDVKPRRWIAPAGSILIRDARLIHRGTENNSEEPRPTISIAFMAPRSHSIHRVLGDVGSWCARKLRNKGREKSHKGIHSAASSYGNNMGHIVEILSHSDRDYHRAIDEDVWQKLSPTVRHLLRNAHVTNNANHSERMKGSFLSYSDLLRDLIKYIRREGPFDGNS